MKKELLNFLICNPKPYVTGCDLLMLLDKSDASRKAIIKRAVLEKYFNRLYRDLYLIQKIPNKPLPDLFEIAQLIWGPSYISFESALSFHGWIPEAVYTTTSACIHRSKTIENSLGYFQYEVVAQNAFSLGVYFYENHDSHFFIADPWKALADMIYSRNKKWTSLKAISEDLRIELDTLIDSDTKLLENVAQNYPNIRVRKILKKIHQILT